MHPVSWRRWLGQQLVGLAALVLGLVVATLVLDGDWGLSAWLVFLVAWLVITAVQAVVRLRHRPAPDDR
ncbi:MAG: hypothetical protein ACTHMW_09985 [Actinomycetes bacterium]